MEISRRSDVAPFIVMDVMTAAQKLEAGGSDVIHMEVGQPGTPAPRRALDALERAMRADPLGYTLALGLPSLRERISRHYREAHGLDVGPERIVVTPGSSGAFILAFLALFDAGQRVAIADPGYPSYRNTLKALDLEPVRLEATAKTRFQPSPDLLDGAGAVDGLLVASPANPTGSVLGRDQMAALAAACKRQGAALISDEIYHRLTYGEPAVTALAVDPDAVVINSFAKYYSMTGWRVGWMVAPEALVRSVERLAQNLFICAPHASQVAAEAAMDAEDELEANLDVYRRNREVLLEELPKAGFTDLAPCDGAFYIYADISSMTNDATAFCDRMLREAGVAATPGLDFDPVRGNGTMRFSFARSTADMIEGARRLRNWRK